MFISVVVVLVKVITVDKSIDRNVPGTDYNYIHVYY